MKTLNDPLPTIPETLVLPPRTVLREGGVVDLLRECRPYGTRGLLVVGRSLAASGTLERLRAAAPSDTEVGVWTHPGGEPTLDHLEALLDEARGRRVEWVAAVGGGSVMDVAKAAAGLLQAPLDVRAYHDGADIPASNVPFIAVPTTAGTGSEATMVAVLTQAATGVKKSIRHPSFMARCVMLDPELLRSCPPSVVAASGMDAFAQALESLLSRKATGITLPWSTRACVLIARNLPRVYGGWDVAAARDLLIGSYLAGLALSNARLGLIHGLAHPLGARYHQPHGLVCAVCLPPVLAFNAAVSAGRLEALHAALGRDPADVVSSLIESLRIRSPFAGRAIVDREALIAETLASGSTTANPREVTAEDVACLLDILFAR